MMLSAPCPLLCRSCLWPRAILGSGTPSPGKAGPKLSPCTAPLPGASHQCPNAASSVKSPSFYRREQDSQDLPKVAELECSKGRCKFKGSASSTPPPPPPAWFLPKFRDVRGRSPQLSAGGRGQNPSLELPHTGCVCGEAFNNKRRLFSTIAPGIFSSPTQNTFY